MNQFKALFGGGPIPGLSDAQLLERFTTCRGEEAELAFAGLVARDGPMVLSVCRGLLRDAPDAEDAFQAIFLVLARKAGSLRHPDLAGPWLYGVAHRCARQIKTGNERRRRRESEAAMSRSGRWVEAGQEFEPVSNDEIEALHEEIGRLPERYRVPIMPCDLQGLTHEEAARRLGRPVGTISARLSRARERLKGRLNQRGVAHSAAVVAAALTTSHASAMPAALVHSTIKIAMNVPMGLTAGMVPASITTISRGVLRSMFLAKTKFISVALILGTAAVGTVAVIGQQSPATQRTSRENNPVRNLASNAPRQAQVASPARSLPARTT